MLTVVLVIHLLLTLALVGLVLLQKSEGGGLATGGGASGGASFLSGRATGNILTKATVALAVCFMATSILLALMASMRSRGEDDLLKALTRPQPAPIAAPAEPQAPTSTAPDALPPVPPLAAPAQPVPQGQESAPPKP